MINSEITETFNCLSCHQLVRFKVVPIVVHRLPHLKL